MRPLRHRSQEERPWPAVSPHRPNPAGAEPARARRPPARRACPKRRLGRHGRAHPPLHRLRPAEGQLVLPRRRRVRRPQPGGADRPLQGGARLPRRQGDLVPELRRALHHPPDHHGDQDGDPLQARAAQHVRLLQPDPAGQDDGECTLGDALPGPGVDDPAVCVISTQELQSLVFCLGTGSRRSSRTPSASTSRATPTRRWPRSSAATRRRSTTRSSA